MKKNKQKNQSGSPLVKKLVLPLLAAVAAQALIFYGTLAFTGTLKDIDASSEKFLAESSSKCAVFLESEMSRKWAGLTGVNDKAARILDSIAAENDLSAKELLENNVYAESFLEEISESLLETLRMNSVSGSFIILADSASRPDEGSPAKMRGIYFSDGDPQYNPSDYSDIMMVRGSPAVSEKHSIPLDINWQSLYDYVPGETEADYFFKPVFAGYDYPYADPDDLGYWSRPFYLSKGNKYEKELIITYSEPLIYENTVFGAVGISVSADRISELMPADDMAVKDGCYALLTYNTGDILADVEAVSKTHCGFEQNTGLPVALVNADDSMLLEIPEAEINGSRAYCAMTEIDLYPENSPYGSERWAVAAVAGKDVIYADTASVSLKHLIAMAAAILVEIIAALVTARQITNPIKALVESVESAGENGCIQPVETGISEINGLSRKLNILSTKRIRYQNELAAERERYLLAIQSTNNSIMEYDCQNDIMYLYKFKSENDGKTDIAKYENFRDLVAEGRVCPESSVPEMMAFLDGAVQKNGVYIRIRAGADTDRLMWVLLKCKNVYSPDGKLTRVIASSKDVTEEKEREQERLEENRRDPVTKFYKYEYGNILASRYSVEMEGKSSITAIVRITDMDKMYETCGRTFCSAVLEEAAIVIRKCVPENWVVYRGAPDEFIILTPITSRDEARELFDRIIDGISRIYDGGSFNVECVIGACLKYPGEPLAAYKLKTSFASEAAYRFRGEFGGVVFADEVSDRTEFMEYFKKNGRSSFVLSGTQLSQLPGEDDGGDIVSFAFDVFEKSSDFMAALLAVINKAGRALGMQRVIVFDMSRDYFTLRITAQWRAEGMAPIEIKTYNYTKADYAELERKLKEPDFKIADTALFERDAVPGRGKISADGVSYSLPMFDNDAVSGVIVFQYVSEADDDLKSCMKELTKVVSAYISKSKTSRESKAKSEFLSKMSHEIRTPMNAIIGMTEIAMSSGDASSYTMECLKKIESSSHYLMSLINDILDMSRIESGKMTVSEAYINLEETIARLDTMIRVQTESKGIWLRAETDIPQPHLLGDPLKLNQILVNILGNAVKFTDSGGVHLRVLEKETDTEGIVSVFFSVRDTGIGIDPENLERIFHSFEQADADTVRKYGGTGLGLAISSSLVRLLGGNLEVKSVPGEGSEFYFTLPMKVTEPPAETDRASEGETDMSSKRVLIAEDDDLNAEIAQTLIGNQGIASERAENGKAAAEMFEASPEGYYDAVLMDIRMPVMDGIEATKRIRGSDRADALKIPIIAMSANAFDEDMKKSVDCGMNGHLTKPIDMKKVMETFRRIWAKKTGN